MTIVLFEYDVPKLGRDLVSTNNAMSKIIMYVFVFPDEDFTAMLINQ